MKQKINNKEKNKIAKLMFSLIVFLSIVSLFNYSYAQEIDTAKEENDIVAGFKEEVRNVKLQAQLTPPYIIGPGDQLTINDRTLKEVSGLTEQFFVTVGTDGYVSIPLPDGNQQNILAAGLTVDEFSSEVRELFGVTLKNPLVFVQINRYRPINVYIGGEVVKPGLYKIESTSTTEKGGSTSSSSSTFGLSLTQAIQLSGGLKPRADITSIVVTRGINQEKKVIDLKKLLLGDTSLDINLLAGDAIFVPSAKDPENQAQKHIPLLGKIAYQEVPIGVFGEVKAGGNYTLPSDATLLDAITKAGGLNEIGSLKKVRLSRYDENGVYMTYHLNVHDLIYNGASFDQIALKPNDTLFLEPSKGKLVRNFINKNATGLFISPVTTSLGNFIVQDNFFNRLTRGLGPSASLIRGKKSGVPGAPSTITVINRSVGD